MRHRLGPLLPAEATTIIPAFATFVDASSDASSAVPKDRPERHVDDVHAVVERHVDRVDGDVRVEPLSAEDAVRVDVGFRGDSRADPERARGVDAGVVRTRVPGLQPRSRQARGGASGVQEPWTGLTGIERVGIRHAARVVPLPV